MFNSSTVMAQSGFCISSASKTFLRSARGFATERYLKFLSPRFSEHVAIFYYKNCDRFCSQLRVFKGSDSCRNASPDVLTCHNYVFCPNHQEGQKLSLQIINATINKQHFVAQAILWLSLFVWVFFCGAEFHIWSSLKAVSEYSEFSPGEHCIHIQFSNK